MTRRVNIDIGEVLGLGFLGVFLLGFVSFIDCQTAQNLARKEAAERSIAQCVLDQVDLGREILMAQTICKAKEVVKGE